MSKTATSGITAYFNIPTLTQLRSCRLIFNQHIPYIGNEIRTLNVPECLFNYAHYVHVAEKLKSFWCTSSCKQSAATSQILAGSLEVNGWLSQLYSITQASQEDNMRTNVPSLLLIITLHCSWQLLHDDNSSFRQLSYTMYFLSRWTTSSWWSVISLKNSKNLSNYI